ncbi:MAG: ABC transporter substrate-binding protein [Proteobacteria bacterium]|nr:ABC transporter substrate-binding protein [Pseudomonadota bacterium]
MATSHQHRSHSTRRHFIGSAAATVAAAATAGQALAQGGDPVLIGVCGPLTGQYAQYGAQWKKGFDLALDEINAGGGINGRPLKYVFEDSQSDPRQTVGIARKFVADDKIAVEVGDFSSAASMAASPIYQAAGMVQFGFTNSHPKFTEGGDFIWSNAVNQADEMPLLADFLKDLGLKRIAILYINSDWGRTAKDILVEAIKKRGGEAVGAEGYLADEKDFRSAIVRVRDTNPDGIALVSYYPDGAQIVRQIKNAGITLPLVAGGSVYSPKFIELGGEAVNGVLTTVPFFPDDPRPEVQKFVKSFVAKFNEQPDAYNGRAYDTFILLAAVMRKAGVERKAIRDGLATISDVSSVVFGKVKFDPATRRVANPIVSRIKVEGGKWVAWSKP